MEGLDLSSILGKVQGVLPILSYVVNMLTRVLTIIGSYFGYDLTQVIKNPETPSEEPAEE